jgi:hypothetical protein
MEIQKIKDTIEEIRNIKVIELNDEQIIDNLLKLRDVIDMIFKLNKNRNIMKF